MTDKHISFMSIFSWFLRFTQNIVNDIEMLSVVMIFCLIWAIRSNFIMRNSCWKSFKFESHTHHFRFLSSHILWEYISDFNLNSHLIFCSHNVICWDVMILNLSCELNLSENMFSLKYIAKKSWFWFLLRICSVWDTLSRSYDFWIFLENMFNLRYIVKKSWFLIFSENISSASTFSRVMILNLPENINFTEISLLKNLISSWASLINIYFWLSEAHQRNHVIYLQLYWLINESIFD